MIDEYLVGKLASLLALETEQDGALKTLLLPKGVIIEFRISSDYDHYVSEEALKEVEDYIDEKNLKLSGVYYPSQHG